MSISAAVKENSLEKYIAQVRSVWGDGKGSGLPFKIKSFLERLLTSTPPEEDWIAQLIQEGLPSKELYRDADYGFIQMGHVHPKGHKNSPHDHGPCWVLYGTYQGVTEITTYRRTDDGKTPGRAGLEKKEVHRLTPGVVVPYLAGDIHSIYAAERSIVFRFLSYDLTKVQRQRFDLTKGTVSLA